MVKPKVVIVGGGFGGLNAAKRLKRADLDLIVLDKTNHHLFQPLLYQVATAALSPGNIASPLRAILARQSNAAVYLADVVRVDTENHYVEVANGDQFFYNYLILAPGSNHSYFGHPEWEKIAPGLKTLNDALTIRERILLSYEWAERCSTSEEAEDFLRFAIVGGGPTGIEMAGAIAEIARITLIKNFRHIKPEDSQIYLIEGEKQLLPSYPLHLANCAQKYLEKMGVTVLLNTKVTHVTQEGVWMGDQLIRTPNVIWAAGNQASPLLKTLQVPLDRAGRVIVNPDLSIPGHPEVFVIGDAALCKDEKGKILPGLAPIAIQQGRYVANLIRNEVPADERRPFKYWDKGTMATVGKDKAVAMLGSFQMSGFIAWCAWCFIHIFYLISFPNRVLVLMQWFFWYITSQRRVRLITRPISEPKEKR
jgi:NADH dehydrogenase